MIVVRFAAVPEEYDDSLLTPPERARLVRLRDASDRAAYVAAHLLVRACAAELLGGSPADVTIAQRCTRCGGGDHGTPYVVGEPDVTVSLSHTRGLVAAVAGRTRCGVDVEAVGSPVPREALSAAEVELVARSGEPSVEALRVWVRKEAVAKATGQDLTRPAMVVLPAGVAVHDWSGEGAVGAWAVERWAVEQR